jgi:23S rRNA (pseudouridine1915-N3)-methyltransferase
MLTMPLDIQFLVLGKTRERWLEEGLNEYEKRLHRYCRYRRTELAAAKEDRHRNAAALMEREGTALLGAAAQAHLILLDVGGRAMDSPGLAQFLQRMEEANRRKLCFAVGGAWGFSPAVYAAAGERLSLSPMTLNHQMVRLLFVEQLYRAFTILGGEPYHHS